ncbi:MAG TPA: YncE family protein, partial [Candidatus Nitrosotalea sp.]|nr:YncE family protein [Candidatus Nitrosotalea sp.]
MGITVGLVLGGMMYLGNFLCVPVENNSCISFLGGTGTMTQASSKSGLALSDNGSDYVVVNTDTNRIYVANRVSDTVSVIDGNTDARIADIPTNGMPIWMAVNPNTNRIYVTEASILDDKHNDTLLVIDGASNDKIAEIQTTIASQIAINQKTNLVYVIGYENGTGVNPNGTLYVIDGNSNTKIAQSQAGMNPFGIAVDSDTNRIYILNRNIHHVNLAWQNSTVSVIDGNNYTKITEIEVGLDPHGLDINPNTHRVYVTSYMGGTVSVIDGISNKVIGKPIFLAPGIERMAVNPITNRIYVADGVTGTVYVIDGSTDTKIKEIHPLWGWSVAVNPITS